MGKTILKISKEILIEIGKTIGGFPDRETGGILGMRNEIITQFAFDAGIGVEKNSYVPDTGFLNRELSEWILGDITFNGLIHSHACNRELSCEDLVYADQILQANGTDYINMFLWILSTETLLAYRVTRFGLSACEIQYV